MRFSWQAGSDITVEVGDTIQTTCVYDSRSRDKPTDFHIETVDEMCINIVMSLHDTELNADGTGLKPCGFLDGGGSDTRDCSAAFTCEGNMWTGQLALGEDGRDIANLHGAVLRLGQGQDGRGLKASVLFAAAPSS